MRSARVIALAAAVLAAAAGVFAYRAISDDRSAAEAATELMRLRLTDISRKEQSLDRWRGRVLVVNFWATWCEPCRKEIPTLLRMQAKYASNGMQTVGIFVDSVDKVQQFAAEYKIGYPLIMGNMAVIDLTRRLGNKAGGLPYTLVLDRSGKVVKTHLGGISEAELESAIKLAGG